MNDKCRRDGTPYPDGEKGLLEWAKDFEDPMKKIVKQETTKDGMWVSTVWLGLDHSFGSGPPLIFETMVFDGLGGDSVNDEQERYSNEAEALAGHEQMVKKYGGRKP